MDPSLGACPLNPGAQIPELPKHAPKRPYFPSEAPRVGIGRLESVRVRGQVLFKASGFEGKGRAGRARALEP